MQPEDKLQREAATSRLNSQSQNKSTYGRRQDNNATIIGYLFATGQNVIRLASGSITYASSDTNGAIALGESAPLNSSSMAIDGLPNKKVITQQIQKAIPIQNPYSFWMLAGEIILQWDVQKNTATLSIITNSSDYPYPYNEFHDDNSGFSRKSKTEFFMPYYHRLALYNIESKSAYPIYGEAEFTRATATFQNTHATYTLPTGDFLFSVEMRDDTNRIYYIDTLGTVTYTNFNATSGRDNNAEAWSIAAINPNLIYMVVYARIFTLLTRETNLFTNVFVSRFSRNSSIYGSMPTGDIIDEITYCFLDTKTNDCYVVGVIIDSGVPGLEMEYDFTYINYIGLAPELAEGGFPLQEFEANFPPNIVNPGDYVEGNDTPGGLPGWGYVIKVISDSRVYIQCSNPLNIALASGDYVTSFDGGNLACGHRHYRTCIWKVTPQLELSLYYKFPTIDNRVSADGYRLFYNSPSRGALIDPKTKNIYMYGDRTDVIENGIYTYRDGFDQGNLIKITKDKKLVVLKNKFSSKVSIEDKTYITNNWYSNQAQLEHIY